jgi:HEAT repeat protein
MSIGTYQRVCTAHRTNGEPCKKAPILGGMVCDVHGGRAPQVRKSAQDRLAEMVDPLLTELFRIAQSGDNDAVRLAAIKDALDRAGYKPIERQQVDQTGEISLRYVNDWRSPETGNYPALPASRPDPGTAAS